MVRKAHLGLTDEELLRGCLEGRQEDWTALVGKYKNLVYGVARHYHLSSEDAAEVFQGVWSDLFQTLGKLEDPGALRYWLVTATSRRSLRMKSHRNVHVEADLAEAAAVRAEEDPSSIREAAERNQTLREAILHLSPRCQKMLRLLFFSEPPRPYNAVAQELGLAVGSIGFTRSRCLLKLKEVLAKMGTFH